MVFVGNNRIGMVESVVDYKSWEKGYMPPTEHVLIDRLSYRGARVNTMSCYGDFTYWIVTEGLRPHGPKMLEIHKMLCDLAEEEIKEKKAEEAVAKAKRDAMTPEQQAHDAFINAK